MIEIVLVGNIARCGRECLSKALRTPHHIRDYPCDLAETHVLVGSPVTPEMLSEAKSLRLIHSSGAGYETIAESPGIPLCNVFHHERAMAEYVILTILALEREIFRLDRNLRAGNWKGSCITGRPRAAELSERKLGIVGFGHIGREVARMAAGFDLPVSAIGSRHARADLERLLADSDFVLIACPLSDETRNLIGETELALMKPTASLINVARGEIVDEEALYEALRERRIHSAAIDVWYQYPRKGALTQPSRYPFHELENIILTPHCSGWTERVLDLRFRDIAANIDRLASGEPLINLVH